jgi:serine acetyltransferase
MLCGGSHGASFQWKYIYNKFLVKSTPRLLIGAGAKILGNIEIGMGAKVGAGSVVVAAVLP